MRDTLSRLVLCGLLLLLPGFAAAAPMMLQLTAGNTLSRTHSGMLIFAVTGTFRQLSGVLTFDPTARTCHIDAIFQVKSLALPNAIVRAEAMSRSFLDPAEYPTERYVGDCRGNRLVGLLTLHGQTHPFDMAIRGIGTNGKLTALHAEGSFDRTQWGIRGHVWMVGRMIKITNDISLTGMPPKPLS